MKPKTPLPKLEKMIACLMESKEKAPNEQYFELVNDGLIELQRKYKDRTGHYYRKGHHNYDGWEERI